jgi:hypothetical protein
MPYSGMLRHLDVVTTENSEERIASIIRVRQIGELGTMLGVTSNRTLSLLQLLVMTIVVPSSPILLALMMETIRSFEPSVLTRAIRRHIPEDGIRHITSYDVDFRYFRRNVFIRLFCPSL